MTAELFVKLAVKIYEERKHSLPSADRDSVPSSPTSISSPSAVILHQTSDDDDSESDPSSGSSGGVPISPAKKAKKPIDYALPLEYVAKQMNLNSNAFSNKDRQWLPKIDSSFWDEYANKLRVNASDKGVCDLEEVDDDYPGVQSPQ